MSQWHVDNRYRWAKVSAAVLRSEPLCRICASRGIVMAATSVDHIVPLRERGAEWDRDNHQPLCQTCHQAKSQREAAPLRGCDADGVPLRRKV